MKNIHPRYYLIKLGEIANSVNSLEIQGKDNSIALWPTVINLEIFAQAPDQTNKEKQVL